MITNNQKPILVKSIAVRNARENALFILDSDNLVSYVLQYSSLSINIVFFFFFF